ncbi:hypothetical protein [Rhodohalobacter sulfatireducens]|uniref:Uncharacterized protein n=1 Tax=Rhodohalobacter sulfatireducens TaxID=2911366 RepID=A0ABS9K8Y3_9BACT|nr:hypothetical protein [Rhodohalobacter sulfatireducens]MCG2587307.1 hypothetical protein [Rhodohalobacter sulfatireducens]
MRLLLTLALDGLAKKMMDGIFNWLAEMEAGGFPRGRGVVADGSALCLSNDS